MDKYDFCGWATRNDLKCSDGRVIRRDAFKDDDGKRVPVVWNHRHDDAFDVLGHADLENRADEGRGVGEAATADQVLQVVHHEDVVEGVAVVFELGDDRVKVVAGLD